PLPRPPPTSPLFPYTSLFRSIEAGQWFEPIGRPGIARLCALAMLRGTSTRDAKAWADALDGIGAAARLDVGSHAATFSAQSLGRDRKSTRLNSSHRTISYAVF